MVQGPRRQRLLLGLGISQRLKVAGAGGRVVMGMKQKSTSRTQIRDLNAIIRSVNMMLWAAGSL